MAADALLAAIAPAVRSTIAQFGQAIRVVAPVTRLRADNSKARTWAALDGAPTTGVVTNLHVERARRTWGAESRVVCELLVEAPAGVALAPGLGVTILTGPRAGQRFVVPIDGVRPEDLAGFATLALASTTDALTVED